MENRATGDYTQAEIMASQVMADTLEFQALAIWDKERPLWEQARFSGYASVVDVGCGTGQISSRLAKLDGFQNILGIDLVPGHVAQARRQFAELPGLRFEIGDGSALNLADASFDVAINRHVIQAIPEPEGLIREMWRVVKPGGLVYFLAEDYGMIHASDTTTDRNWLDIAEGLLDQGTDLLIGRKLPQILSQMGLPKPEVQMLQISTYNTNRQTMAGIMRTWRDGYTDFLSENTELGRVRVEQHFESLIQCCIDPRKDLVWHIPIVMVAKPQH